MGAYDVRLRSPGPVGITTVPLPASLLGGGTQNGLAVIHDEFNRADTTPNTAGREDGGKLWVASSSHLRLERLVTPGGVGYTSLDLKRTARRMLAGLVFTSGTGTANAAALFVCDVMNAGTWNTIIVYFYRTVAQVHVAVNGVFTQVGATYTYGTPCLGDDQTVYQVGWTLMGDDLVVEMPDGTTQVFTDVRFATPLIRGNVVFHHSNVTAGDAEVEFDWVTVDPVAVTSATTMAKGVVKLAGDLAGTAEAPTVPSKQSLSEKNLANGYPGLSAASIVNPGQLGTGIRDNTKFLRDDSTWQPLPGGQTLPDSVIHDNEAAVTTTGVWTFAQPVSMPVPTLAAHPVRKTEFDPVINTFLPAKQETSQKGVANGYASLNAAATVPPAQLATGTPTVSVWLRGDGTWATLPAGTDPAMVGDITGTASANQIATGVIVNADVNNAAAIDQTKILNLVTNLAAKQESNQKGVANGYPSLGASATVPVAQLGTGTPTSSLFLRGDGTWATVSAAGDPVMGGDISGTTSNAQIVAGAVTNAEVNNAAAIDQTKILNLVSNLAAKQETNQKGVANGYPSLGASTTVPPVQLGTGTPTVSLWLRGDGSWATLPAGTDPAMGGDLTGTASAAQIAAGVIVNADVNNAAAIDQTKILNLTTNLAAKQETNQKGVANGYPSLNATTTVPPAQLGTGTPTVSLWLRGDGSWATLPAGTDPVMGGDITGNASNAQIAAGVIVNADVSPTAAIGQEKILNLVSRLNEMQNTSQKGVANGYPGLNASSFVPPELLGANVPTSSLWLRGDSTWATLPAGTDPAMVGDITGTASANQIGAGVIVNADVNNAAAIAESKLTLATDAAAGVGSRRTLGTGALQATAGTDARLSDARNPLASSVVNASVSNTAAIDQSKILNLVSNLAAKAPLANPFFTTNVEVTGGVYSNGTAATLAFDDRTTNTEYWAWYSNAQVAYLWNSVVSNVVSVTRAGDISTASVTLSAAPTLTNHATRKGYVDTALAAKQDTSAKDVANGYAGLNASTVVPPARLGTGTPTSSLWLRGDGAWSTLPTGTDPPMGGDLTGTASNAQLAAGAIFNADVNDGAALAQSKIANLINDLSGKQATSTNLTTISGVPNPVATNVIRLYGKNSLGQDSARDMLTTVGEPILTATSTSVARTALGLGGSATLNVGTAAGTVASGNGPFIASGATNETTTGTVQARLGVFGATARVILEDPLAAAANMLWQIDNQGGLLRFFVPGSVKMSLDPNALLNVNAVTANNGKVRTLGTGAGLEFLDRSGTALWQWYANGNAARLWDGDSDVMTVDPTGRVSAAELVLTGALYGVSIGSPLYQSAAFAGPYINMSGAAGTGTGTLDIANRVNTANNVVRILGIANQTGDLLQVFPDGATMKTRIDKDGTVHSRAIYGKASNAQTFNLTVGNSTNVKVPLGTEENTGLTWTFSPNYEWQIITPGLYYIEGNATWQGDNMGARVLAIFKNAVSNLANNQVAGTGDSTGIQFEVSNHVSTIVRLVAGDKINLIASSYKNDGSSAVLFNHDTYSPNLIIVKVGN